MANELEEKIQITSWDLFSLNRRFILEFTGEILTYSVTIWQIATEWNHNVNLDAEYVA